MLIKDQKVEMVWNPTNRKWYEERNYLFTRFNDKFLVDLKDLQLNSNKPVKVICDYCGEQYTINYNNYNKGESGIDACKKCRHKRVADVTRERREKKYMGLVQQVADKKGYTVIYPQEYKSVKTRIKYICPKHGEHDSSIANFIRGKGCKDCANEQVRYHFVKDAEEVEEYINSFNGNKLLNKEDYITSTTNNLIIQCSCGNTYTTSLSNYKMMTYKQCPHCRHSYSIGERIIERFLNVSNIEYIKQKTFEDCKDEIVLPFDFYLPYYNCCIEFDGQGHFAPVWGEKSFTLLKKHDEIKNNYCANNNIKLLRIPYWDGGNIEDIIIKELDIKLSDDQLEIIINSKNETRRWAKENAKKRVGT